MKVLMLDPSDVYRPECPDLSTYASKEVTEFRDFSPNNPLIQRIFKTYTEMHTNQTVDYVKGRHECWLKFNHFKATVREALEKLNDLVDESDPDIDLPNIVHAFQTAERARTEFPEMDWLHLTGLIHDMGKVMAFYDEPQWSCVGDTFPVGCDPSENVVFRKESFDKNPDLKNPKYNTKLGIYEENCGIQNLMMSWGHDEYLYHCLKHNKTTLPEEALQIIRYHSFYPWHTSNDYSYFEAEGDEKMKNWINLFNRYDLYTKCETLPDIEALWPYYQSLIDKYLPGKLEF